VSDWRTDWRTGRNRGPRRGGSERANRIGKPNRNAPHLCGASRGTGRRELQRPAWPSGIWLGDGVSRPLRTAEDRLVGVLTGARLVHELRPLRMPSAGLHSVGDRCATGRTVGNEHLNPPTAKRSMRATMTPRRTKLCTADDPAPDKWSSRLHSGRHRAPQEGG
jgi:hypothetical protein